VTAYENLFEEKFCRRNPAGWPVGCDAEIQRKLCPSGCKRALLGRRGWLLVEAVLQLRRREKLVVASRWLDYRTGWRILLGMAAVLAAFVAASACVLVAAWLSQNPGSGLRRISARHGGSVFPAGRNDGSFHRRWRAWPSLTIFKTCRLFQHGTGDIPPHFSLNPSLRFGYHYFSFYWLAMDALGAIYPWNALDLARSFTLALLSAAFRFMGMAFYAQWPRLPLSLWYSRVFRRGTSGC